MLVGVFLAVIAFVGVLVLSSSNKGPDPNAPPTEAVVVIALEDIPLGSVITDEQVENQTLPIAGVEADAYNDQSAVIGQTARQEVLKGGQITARTTTGGVTGQAALNVPAGYRALSVLVDQVTGVGTLIKVGDYVDALVRFEIQPTEENEEGEVVPVEGVDTTSTKLLIQGMQVIGVILPPPPAAAEGEAAPQPGTVLNNQQQLVILAVTPSQAEVLKFAEDTAGQTVSLVLRSPADFLDENGNPRLPESPCITAPLPTPTPLASGEPEPSPTPEPYRGCETTDGIVLSSLIFQWGVLVPPVTGGPVTVIPTAPPAVEEPTESPAVSPAP
jgi:pilus assembly protein CpaB